MTSSDTGLVRHPAIPIAGGLRELAGGYDGFILDLWGTIHDGVRPLPGAIDALRGLRQADKAILILSNAPRRVGPVVERMDRIGVPRDLYDTVLSSGEAGWCALHERTDSWHRALGRACYLMGAEGDDSAIAGLDLDRVADIATAEFIVCTGLKSAEETVADYEDLLTSAVACGLPMACVNPDLEVLRGGVRELCAGALAARYQALGGDVFYHGKPHAPIYVRSLDLLGIAEPARVLAVGDSLSTDVAGAEAAGIDSVLVTGGIHAEALGIAPLETPEPQTLAAFCAAKGQRPTAALAAFRW